MPKVRNRVKSIPKLVDELDKVFSKYIRLRDSIKTTKTTTHLLCVTCGKNKDQKYECDAGHFVGRGAGETRFDERNVHGQCKYCNMGANPTMHMDYEKAIVRMYGEEVRDELVRLGKQSHTWNRQWLEEKIVYYKEKLKEMC